MKLVKVKTLLLSCLLFFAFLSSEAIFADPIEFSLKAEATSIQPGFPFWVALNLDIEDSWHAYWKNPGDAGMPPQIEWDLPEGFVVQGIEWPYPSRFIIGSARAFGYSGKTILLAKIVPPATLSTPQIEIKADLRWVVCNDETCLPGSSAGTLTLPVKDEVPQLNSKDAAFFQEARGKIPQKSGPVKTKKEKSIIEGVVEIERFSKRAIAEAEFFPENSNVEVTISSHPKETGQVVLTYKEEKEEAPLKGVLVAGGKAYSIDLGHEASEIAFNESPADLSLPNNNSQVNPQDKIDNFALALLFAFLGGIILNLMPCVLPVVSLKVLSFVNMAKECKWKRMQHGLYFTLGVLLSFWVLAGVMLLLQAWGHSVGWGFQLQEPLFVAILAVIMLVFALSLFGVFEMGALFASWAGQKDSGKKEGPLSALFSGILATAVATPCTGPFLGSAIGYAFTLPPFFALVIFTFLALGMALPYLVLAMYPPLLRFVPRPGKWMETFKQAMGFMMLLATLWLTWVFAGETNEPASTLLLAAYFIVAFLCWMLGKWGTPVSSKVSRYVSHACAIILCFITFKTLILASSLTSFPDITSSEIASSSANKGWEPFSLQRVEELRKEGVPVFIDFTAKWCLICQANHLVLSTREVEAKMKEKGVVKMKADWTRNDPEITAELQKWGRSGVPLYLLYGSETPQILPQVLTPDGVMAFLDEMPDAH